MYMFVDKAIKSRTDGSLVRLTVMIQRDDIEAADATVLNFFDAMTPELGPFVPN